MPIPSLLLAAAFLSAVLVNPLSARITLSQGVRGWLAAIWSDPAAILFVVAVVVLIAALVGAALAARARRRERQREAAKMTAVSVDVGAIVHWVEEGRRFFIDWQERIERLDELQRHLTAMTEEVGQLQTQVSRMDALQAENLRLAEENDALLRERDRVRAVIARFGELIRQASEARPRTHGPEP